MSFLYRLKQFMQGRCGLDQLSVALVITGCVLTFILSFIRVPYYRLIGLIPYIFATVRILSRNIDRRRAENERFLKIWYPWKNFFKKKQSQAQDYNHKYYRCPQCGHTLRVPKYHGKIEITCPYCQKKFKRNTGKKSSAV